jgi:hypothetical protein
MFDRAKIMKDAWKIVRRFAGNRETPAQRMSRALKSVWWDAKRDAHRAIELARQAAAEARKMVVLSLADLRLAVLSLENSDRLGWAGMQELSALRGLLVKREAEALPRAV